MADRIRYVYYTINLETLVIIINEIENKAQINSIFNFSFGLC